MCSEVVLLLMMIIIERFLLPVQGFRQRDLDNLATNMEVRYDVLDNLNATSDKFSPTFLAQVTLTNKGQSAIAKGNWAVHFCNIRLAEPAHLAHNPAGYVLPGGYGIKFTHINGCLHKFETTDDFKDIVPGQSFKFKFKAAHWSVARTDVMPKWYVTASGLTPKVITSTTSEDLDFVGPFDGKEKWKRFSDDVYDPYTPEKRFDIIEASDLGKAPSKVIPTPVSINIDESKKVQITKEWIVYISPGLENEAAPLSEELVLKVSTSQTQQTKLVTLTIGDVSVPEDNNQYFPSRNESYSLQVDIANEVVSITGQGAAGVFYGVQTLLALLDSQRMVHGVSIIDSPRYAYRGMHLDVARNFVKKSDVLKLLDVMAMYKLNKFHFHLTDDEGWRLEIPELPELTQVGSKRCFDLDEKTCLLSQLGSGPDSSSSGSGYYTVKEYQEILEYASKRHIQVIPEFDMPGHGNSPIKAMLARHDELSAKGNEAEAKRYLLSEANDTSRYLSVQYFSDNAINPCIESTYNFIQYLVEAVVKIHNDSQPLTTYHFGGDEVAHGAWTNSPACKILAQELGLNYSSDGIVDELKDYFVERVANITANYSLELAGWEDGLMDDNNVPYNRTLLRNHQVFGYAWNNIWEWGSGKRAYELANAGYQVVMSQATHLYFDHPYEPDPEERGFYWATRFTDTRKVFGFMPDDLFANVEVKRSGAPFTREELCMTDGMCPKLKKKENIVGMAGHLWTETVRTADQMNRMIFPRMIALAERAWHKAPWESVEDKKARDRERAKDWQYFANSLGYRELARLDEMGVVYHVPPPGARVNNNKLKTKVAIPGLKVQYSADGGNSWRDVEQDMEFYEDLILTTKSADGSTKSRDVLVEGQPRPKGGCLRHLMTSHLLFLIAFVIFTSCLSW